MKKIDLSALKKVGNVNGDESLKDPPIKEESSDLEIKPKIDFGIKINLNQERQQELKEEKNNLSGIKINLKSNIEKQEEIKQKVDINENSKNMLYIEEEKNEKTKIVEKKETQEIGKQIEDNTGGLFLDYKPSYEEGSNLKQGKIVLGLGLLGLLILFGFFLGNNYIKDNILEKEIVVENKSIVEEEVLGKEAVLEDQVLKEKKYKYENFKEYLIQKYNIK